MTNGHPTLLPLTEARSGIEHGDLLLFRARRSLSHLVIARGGRTRYTHAARVAWEDGELRCLDTIQGTGGRNVSLRDQVERYPGHWDVFRPSIAVAEALGCTYEPDIAVNKVREYVDRPYGWKSLARAALVHLPVVRFFVKPETDDQASVTWPPYCSQLQAMGDRAAGFDPVVNLADRMTEPGDLARSLFYEYQFTLVPWTVRRPSK